MPILSCTSPRLLAEAAAHREAKLLSRHEDQSIQRGKKNANATNSPRRHLSRWCCCLIDNRQHCTHRLDRSPASAAFLFPVLHQPVGCSANAAKGARKRGTAQARYTHAQTANTLDVPFLPYLPFFLTCFDWTLATLLANICLSTELSC